MGLWKCALLLLYVRLYVTNVDCRFFLTIGFGDFYPVTEAGRPVFLVYALLAVPTMTIIGKQTHFLTDNSTNSNEQLRSLHSPTPPSPTPQSLQRKRLRNPIPKLPRKNRKRKNPRKKRSRIPRRHPQTPHPRRPRTSHGKSATNASSPTKPTHAKPRLRRT
jgi:hypothetical protein